MKNQHFWHKKLDSTLFHDFSASQLSYPANNVQNTTFQLRRNSGETDLVTQIHQNMPKIGCFWPFSHFFCFWGPFFEKLDLRICLFIHQMWDEISQMTNICHKFTQNGTFKFYQKRNCPLSNARWAPSVGGRGGQKTEHQNFQVGTLNCGDTSLTELKNIWV